MEIHYCFLTRQECNSDHSYIHVICVEHCIAKSIKLYYAYSTLYCIKCIISCIVLNILYTVLYCNPHHTLYCVIIYYIIIIYIILHYIILLLLYIHREENRARDEEYRRSLKEMQDRVKERPLLFEKTTQVWLLYL